MELESNRPKAESAKGPSKTTQPFMAWFEELQRCVLNCRVSVAGKATSLAAGISEIQDTFLDARERGSNVWWVGNGGSSAICAHLSQDLLNKLSIKSQCLSNVALLTCMANDFGYENIYSKPLETLFEKNDVLVAISSSGNSKNILSSAKIASDRAGDIIALSGFGEDNLLSKMNSRVSIYVPAKHYGIAEVAHETILHGAIETLFEKAFCLGSNN